MTRKELEAIRKKNIQSIVNTLSMIGEKVKVTDNNDYSFTWDGHFCHVSSHKVVGAQRKYMVVEYCTDVRSDIQRNTPISIFIDYENPSVFYSIPTTKLYNNINNGLVSNKRNFHITNTGDVLRNNGLCISVDFDTFVNMDGIRSYNIKEVIDRLPEQYTPLVNKLIGQFFSKNTTSWDQLYSMAWEGFALAIHNYDAFRSKMNFMQYAAFAIRNNILTSLDDELRTVKLSNYAQKKAIEKGEALFNSVSIDSATRDDDEDRPMNNKLALQISSKAKFDDGDVFEYVYSRVESSFTERDCLIFYKAFGLKGYDDMKGKDIAKEFGISEGLVSQKIKKITTFIRKDDELCEMLQNLM